MFNSSSKKKFFHNFNYIDPVKEKIHPNTKMIVFEEVIQAIGSKIEKPIDAIDIDLENQYVMPGLINIHCHLSDCGISLPKILKNEKILNFAQKRKFYKKINYKIMKKNAMTTLLSGTTTIRSLGEMHFCIFDLRDNINAGKENGSRIYTCGKAIGIKGGHGGSYLTIEITNVEEAREAIKLLIKKGADCVKLMATGGVIGAKTINEVGLIELSTEMMTAICDIAHANNLKVTAHCQSNEGAWICIEAKINSIEHGSNYDEKLLDKLKEVGIATVPTLASGLAYSEYSGLSEIEAIVDKKVTEYINTGLRRAISNEGILIGAGDDAGVPLVYHGKIAQEIKMLHEDFGLSPMESIKCATINNAKIMGREDKLGSLDVGKFADFIIFSLNRNPMDNIDYLFDPNSVYKGGIKIR